AAVAARPDPDFVVIARPDARGGTSFYDAVRPAPLFFEAGADAIFPQTLERADGFAAFPSAVKAPLFANTTQLRRSPNLDFATLATLGYRMVLYPLTAFRSALRAAETTLKDLRDRGHQRDRIHDMLTRAELYELLDYQGYEERDRKYFG